MEKRENKRLLKVLYYILIIGCILGGVYQYSSKIVSLNEKRKLKNSRSRVLVYGKIHAITNVQKSSRKMIFYEFVYGNKSYDNSISDVFTYKCALQLRNKLFPIVIDSLNPNRNRILFHKRDYNYFGYPIPENMSWVFECVKPSGSYIFSTAPISPD